MVTSDLAHYSVPVLSRLRSAIICAIMPMTARLTCKQLVSEMQALDRQYGAGNLNVMCSCDDTGLADYDNFKCGPRP